MHLIAAVATLLWPVSALATDGDPHADPILPVLLALALILFGAKLGGDVATRLGQPAVLGELVLGVVIGNLGLVGYGGLEPLKTDAAIDMLSRLGVLLLLFEVGLESTVSQMLRVGLSSLLVATFGVMARGARAPRAPSSPTSSRAPARTLARPRSDQSDPHVVASPMRSSALGFARSSAHRKRHRPSMRRKSAARRMRPGM